MEQVYEAEIKLLQEEIALLQNQQENNEREVILHIEEHTQRTLTSQPDFKRGKNDAVMNLEKLEEDLARQTKINGIVLKECEVKTLEKSRTKIVQRYRVSGNCSFLNFQVEFELTEIQEEDGTIVRRITALNIVVDGCELIDISTFVSGVEETKSLLLFFRALRAFSERCEQRSRTFAHFKRLSERNQVRPYNRFAHADPTTKRSQRHPANIPAFLTPPASKKKKTKKKRNIEHPSTKCSKSPDSHV
ncbi:centromere protein P isoform X2 [Anguilla rostrata]|uniref:centromere protein P isoform X2 n=1 Tax=Anguilla rostrata TaxID=7938 RepID=UPI0030CFF7F9